METTSTTNQTGLNKFLLLLFFIVSLGYTQSLTAQNSQQCYSSPTNPNVTAKQTWSVNSTAGTVTIRTTFAKTFVDNTYGANAVGWGSKGHKFNDLVGSDHVQLALYDANNVKKLEFSIDYISASSAAPSGYKTLGVTGGDGKMILGNSSDVLSARTSLDSNFNGYGYVLTSNSPATDPNYTPNPAYPKWIFEVWYEVTVKLSAFSSGFGRAQISDVHASPSKTGNNTEVVNPGPCSQDSVPASSGCASCKLGYPDNSNLPRSAVEFSESDVLVAFDPGPSICGAAPEYIKVYYTDEHALTLGVRRVIVKTNSGTTTTDYPITASPSSPTCVSNPNVGDTISSGDQAGNDVADGGGRPLWPALFLTDLTVNGAPSRAGDWQQGGKGTAPSKVCGTWKAAVRTVDKTKSTTVVTVTPDADPVANNSNLGGGDNPPAGTKFEQYSAEVAWKLSDLNLIPGHSYRLQFMVHDGDQNKSGGDAGDTCTTMNIPASPNPSSIGDFVFNDNGGGVNGKEGNGIQDAGEPGVPNILVKLFDETGDLVDATVTDSLGHYIFNNVSVSTSGTKYKVQFSNLPVPAQTNAHYAFTIPFRGTDSTRDSNVLDFSQQSNGETPYFTVLPNQSRLDIDAGIIFVGGPLAVTISSFQGKYDNGVSTLNWGVSSQDNLSSYDVQRSNDGITFNTIGNVKAIANNIAYTFNDKIPASGSNYYRLKNNDKNGSFSFSNIVLLNVTFTGINIRSIYPSPFRDQLKVSISSENAELINIRILDEVGRVVKLKNLTVQKGSNEILFDDMNSLRSGVYIVEVKTPFKSLRTKVSK